MGERIIFSGQIFRLTVEEIVPGQIWERVYQKHGVTIFPITEEGHMCLTRITTVDNTQPRLRPVTGYIEAGEDPLDCAKRELAEELGLEAKDWELFTEVDGGSVKKRQYFFVARGLSKFKGRCEKDPNEKIEPVDFAHDEVMAMTLAKQFGGNENAFVLLKFVIETPGFRK